MPKHACLGKEVQGVPGFHLRFVQRRTVHMVHPRKPGQVLRRASHQGAAHRMRMQHPAPRIGGNPGHPPGDGQVEPGPHRHFMYLRVPARHARQHRPRLEEHENQAKAMRRRRTGEMIDVTLQA
jgi:hypothetical protein